MVEKVRCLQAECRLVVSTYFCLRVRHSSESFCIAALTVCCYPAELIDGKAIAATIRQEIAAEVAALKEKTGKVWLRFSLMMAVSRSSRALHPSLAQVPGLAVVLVGARKDSETYVRNKKKACEEVGITSFGTDLPETVSEEELLKVPCTQLPCIAIKEIGFTLKPPVRA